MRRLLFCLALVGCVRSQNPADEPFVEKPYLQLGNHPALSDPERMAVLWHAADTDAAWGVRYRSAGADWQTAPPPTFRRVLVADIPPHRVYQAELTQLKPGTAFDYEVRVGEKVLFAAQGHARPNVRQPYRFVIFGDIAQGTPSQRAVAAQVAAVKPDAIMVTGDIVYGRGKVSEYRSRFFPVYNSEQTAADLGAPLLRKTLWLAAPGNHDILNTDMGTNPDGLAYFYYWAQPLNGPLSTIGAPNSPILKGEPGNHPPFIEAARGQYPQMANFSFDYGNAHWTVLDSNPYVDWTAPAMREWVRQDLAKAQQATWRFVVFHHPGFNSAKTHFENQWMRVMDEVFRAGKVDVVFSGHVHNYQRSYPLAFKPKPTDGQLVTAKGLVDGEWTLDKQYDGVQKTKPQGLIYIVTGAGGAGLYNPEQTGDRSSFQSFTDKFVSDRHSFTQLDVDGARATVRQIDEYGAEVDRFVITK